MSSLSVTDIDTTALQLLNAIQAWHYKVVPAKVEQQVLYLFHNDTITPQSTYEELTMLLDYEIKLHSISADQLRGLLGKHYRLNKNSESTSLSARDLSDTGGDLLEKLIDETAELGGSDIHFEPYEFFARIRIRIDGALVEKFRLPKASYSGLVNQLKIKANLDIAEKRLPQDGRIQHQWYNQQVDIRVSTLPALHGEKIVLRLLINRADSFDLNSLGLSNKELTDYLEATRKPSGITLISGPTGSGKTTTLYATLIGLNDAVRNILTIEDPIEYTLEGINQVQLREAIGLDFANALRTFLRQDPDTIMVGEIRDLATANMAIRASLTGHQVLSTIHTNSAWGIVSRLIDLGVPAYLLADTLNAAVAQRLIRLLCSVCKQEKPYKSEEFPPGFEPSIRPTKVYHPLGCAHCHYTGFQGRRAIYEVILIDRELAGHIRQKDLDVKDILASKNIKSLSDQAFTLVANGLSCPSEVYPILY